MKTLTLLLLLGSLAVGCKKDPSPVAPEITVGQPFSLAAQQHAAVPVSSGGPARATLTEIVDARCPSGMQCIWEGYVAVTVALTAATNPPQTARICLSRLEIPTYTRDSVAVTLNQKGYWLRLLAVSDSPTASAKTATLRLRPQ